MRLALLAALGCGALALAGCSSTTTVSTPVSTATVSTSIVTAVTIGYHALCVGSSATPSILGTIQLLPLNAQRQADIASFQAICNNGSPTNIVTATIDGLDVYSLLKRDFPQLSLQ
jgi:hypothetical protein